MPSGQEIQSYLDQAVHFVRKQLGQGLAHGSGQKKMHGLILGSGLGKLADQVAEPIEIAFDQIPHFPVSTVAGHSGRLVFGTLAGIPVMVMAGRVHLYEGYAPWQVGFPVRLLHDLGCTTLLLSNAAGALRADLPPGQLMLITDHINLTGANPLTGAHYEQWGDRFVDMSRPYHRALIAHMERAGADCGVSLAKGVYLATHGPSYETAAEVHFMARLGGDAVGMSTVYEVIVAAQYGLPVCALSLITNLGTGLGAPQGGQSPLSHAEVTDMGARRAADFGAVVRRYLTLLDPLPNV